ncbi:MAG: CopG family transcriptional regulator [Verrucomicrobia bacterium]|nr:CopG family transcriptional regulator [Verrucomicrobiota bacterium]
MKTTINLSDDLLVEAKKRAAEERRPLRALIEDALREKLAAAYPEARRRINWVVAEGGAPEEVGDREAMYDWLDRHP